MASNRSFQTRGTIITLGLCSSAKHVYETPPHLLAVRGPNVPYWA